MPSNREVAPVEIVLGVSMAPTTVRTALVEGEDADGVSVEEASFEVAAQGGAPEQVIATILGTREGAAEAGHRLTSTGVTWTEPTEVGALRDALAFREIRGVMLVSPLLAAAALTQTVGLAMDYGSTALLFVEPESATLAVVDTADGSIVDLHRQAVRADWRSTEEVNQLAAMIAALDGLESRPDGVFVVGCGVDIMPIKPQLDATVSVPVSAPEEPDMALARGAALASANAPLFASSTAALAYAQDPGTGENVLAPDYLDVSANARLAEGALAYSALADEDDGERRPSRRPLLLAGSGLAAVLLVGFVTLAISLAADVGSTLGQRTGPHGSVVPTTELPVTPSTHGPAAAAPVPSAPSAAPPPSAPPPSVEPPPPPQTITAPTPVVQQVPQPVMTPAPVHRAPTRQVPAYTPPPAAEGPPPAAPAPPPPAAPTPPPPQLPPMVMYLHLPFVTVPIPINPPPPPPPAQPGP